MSAPVTTTAATPSASGSAAAASDPKTTSRTISTIGRPMSSACSRSSFESCWIPAQSALWPTRCSGTAAPFGVDLEVLAHHGGGVDGLVAAARDDERHHDHVALAGGAGGGQRLRVQPHALDVLEALALDALERRGQRLRVMGPVVEDDREVLGLHAREIAGQGVGHGLRARALGLEPASGQVLGLPAGERDGDDDEHDPGDEHEAPAAGDEPLEPIHGCLHVRFLQGRGTRGQPMLAILG